MGCGPESHSQSTKKASAGGPSSCLAQWAQYLWGRNAPWGRLARLIVLGPPACARQVYAAADHVPRLLTVSAQHAPPHWARSNRHTTPEAPELGRAEGSQGPKSTWTGGRAQKCNRRARSKVAAAMNRDRNFASVLCTSLRKWEKTLHTARNRVTSRRVRLGST
jgi:hypothetical protein